MTTDHPGGAAWEARWRALYDAEGEEWDRLDEALCADWKGAYVSAFVACAVARGWSRENAQDWAADIVNEALLDARGRDAAPQEAAVADVVACEAESA